jgi:hypothetical protein
MLVQVHTDNHIQGSAGLKESVSTNVQESLARFGDRLTRVEVFLSDTNSHKGGDDKKCVMEARPAGMQPIAVSHIAPHVHEAIDGAIERLLSALDHSLGKQADHKGRPSMSGDSMETID